MSIILFESKLLFILGFVISFISVFLFEYAGHVSNHSELSVNKLENSKTLQSLVKSWPNHSENYGNWRRNQTVIDSTMNLDTFFYTTQSKNDHGTRKELLEADWLKKKISITCVVFVKNVTQASCIKDTWGKRCNHLLFFSKHLYDSNLPIINLKINYSSSWHLLYEVLNYIWKIKNELQLQWLILVEDGTFVIPENLRFLLAPLDFQKPYYLGHAVTHQGLPYNEAKAGYVLSYKTLLKLNKIFNTSAKCATSGKNTEDYTLAKHLASLKIYPSDTRDSELKRTFHRFSANQFWEDIEPDYFYTGSLHSKNPKCCSKRSVTFLVENVNKMRTLNYMLYELYIFKNGTHGNVQAPTLIPENEVWKIGLFREFNLTIIDEISSEEFYNIWVSKYPDTYIDHFIFNFQNGAALLILMVLAIIVITKKRRSELRILRVLYNRCRRNYFSLPS